MSAVRAESLPTSVSGSRAPGWWGMALLIGTEAMLFGSLIASYFFLRFRWGPVWPPEGIAIPELSLPLVMTAVLLSSSIPMHLADTGIRAGRLGRLRWGLALSFVLGAAFLGLQVFEYSEKLAEFSPTSNVYGSLFFTITGFHGTHVLIGLILNAWTQVRAYLGHFGPERHLTVQNVALYWHFVDVVWIFIFASLYLSPNV